SGPREVGAKFQRLAYRPQDRRISVTEANRAVAHSVLDVFVAVRIPDVAAGTARNEGRRQDGILVVPLGIGVCSAWNDFVCPAIEPIGHSTADGLRPHPAPPP